MDTKSKILTKFGVFALTATLGLYSAPVLSQSVDVPAPPATTTMYVVDGRLRDVIDALGMVMDARIVQSNSIVGRVSQKELDGTVDEVLAVLATDYELDWFAFNGHYYVSLRRETVSRVIRLGDLTSANARSALADAGLAQHSLQIMDGSDGASLILSGAPQLVAFCEVIIANIPDFEAMAASAPEIIVRRGITVYAEPLIASAANRIPEVLEENIE